MNVLDARQQLEQELTNMTSDKGQLREAEAGAVATERKIEQTQKQFLADQADKLAAAIKQRDHLTQDAIKSQAKAQRTRLLAPIDGIVQQLAVTTIGQVISPGQALLVVVPQDGPLEIEALVPNSDFGFIRLNQEAVVKVDAFPFGRYGTLDGKVVRVSHDSVYDKDVANGDAASPQIQNSSTLDTTPKTQGLVYPVTVQLARPSMFVDGNWVSLAAGMTATVEIRTGDRRVIDYLLSPLREIVSQAAHER
jgi:hemolysin D